MAKIKFKDEEIEVADGSEMREPCEKMGVPFHCRDGHCGSCMIEVKKGEENLSEATKNEENLGMGGKYRLACQCCAKKGEVEIDF
ncbi:MAG: 2Fe-2S iron-sulfur cluster-binding protein [Nanoarchaeota archaeon]|nr:2Fe-2S iron-sulfur cluster-binding protein [Nanoarchaeota archaeon]